jgi:drug/metabolite transporter (DMT)-like permease
LAERRQRAAAIGGLMALCLLWAAALLRADLLPGTGAGIRISPLELEALLLGMLAAFAGFAGLVRKVPWPRGKARVAAMLAGVGIFVAPAMLTALSMGLVDDATRVALFSLVPVFAVVFEPHLGTGTASARGGLAAGMVAVVGTLLVFPVEIPQTAMAGLGFCAVLVAAASVAAGNCLGVATCRRDDSVSWLGFGAVAAGVAAVLIGAAGLGIGRGDANAVTLDAWAVPDLAGLVLLFWLMPRMSAVRMSTRFLIAPLLANLIGLAFLRPGVQWRGWVGLALIALGSGWLLFAPDERHDESTLTLDLT